ncbi:exodeoxyribonuclease V subunit beta [Thiohalospira sp.]|uniref:exodeoxyribonuclease V subunit beta n=1 Tax=Thiohalospira sp. TaxID=3080549 RepID=UPI0039809E7D
MSTTPETRPLDLPLSGLRLVEASAGTGKTFTLAGLYLRLLVEQQRTVREILVMTFTRAATQELRERIRWWLARAATLARVPGQADPARAEDTIITDLLGRTDEERGELARRLTEAATRMDEATITTIHGFSRMAVQEHAFDSGIAFDRGEQTEDDPLIEEAATDYWRRRVIGGEDPSLAALWSTPEAFVNDLRPLLARPHQRIAGPDTESARESAAQARAAWADQREALQGRLENLVAAGALHGGRKLGKRLTTPGDVPELLAELDAAVAAGPVSHPLMDVLGSESFGKQLTGRPAKEYAPDAVTDAADAVLAARPEARLLALREAADAVRTRVAAIKAERRLFSYDDLITGLHGAVHDPDRGPTLARALHQRWPAALVDEFQDTDPLQYQILQRVYSDRDEGALILIGDPKQAIYSFRGGDVFAYLQATDDADGRYHLDTNFRSTAGVIQAVDTLFSHHERPFVLEEMAFRPVQANSQQGRGGLRVDGEPVAPLTLWTPPADEELVKAPDAKAALLRQCVATIRRLLDPETEVRRLQNEKDEPLQPRDICVLVNTNTEASEVQQALSRQNIPAASGHRDNIFKTPQAQELVRLLRAAATPADAARLRVALIGELFGCRLGDLQALAEDEARWQRWYVHLQQAHRRWADHGVLAMLEPLIQAAAPRLLALEDGERRMTNWLHLAEQLQAAEPEAFGMAGLIRWLEEQMEHAGEGDNEAAELRLESEADRVQIVTIHRSKGLEYPVVMAPFAYRIGTPGRPEARPDKDPFAFHDDDHQAWLDPRSKGETDEKTVARAVREHKAEALRLLYVAVTRARQAVYLGWGPINGAQNSALAWLLHAQDGCAADQWQSSKEDYKDWFTPAGVTKRLETLAHRSGETIHLEPVDPGAPPVQRLEPEPRPAGAARQDRPEHRPFWGVLSFSALVRNDHTPMPRAGAEDETREEDRLFTEAGPIERLPSADLEDLAGPDFGTAIHDLLEEADFATWPAPGNALTPEQGQGIRSRLLRHGIPIAGGNQGAERVAAVGALVSRTLHTPLPALGPLARLPRHRVQVEMPFTLRLGGEQAGSLIHFLRHHGYATALPESQRSRVLRGLMQGYIDLVAEADGRYWVLDYKTNRLPTPGDYAPERLGEAVRASHYDLQYLIYLTALHRYLRQRLPDYDPARHLGGAQYLFLRGLTGEADGYGVFQDCPDPDLIQALDARFDAAANAPGGEHGRP